MKCLNEINKNTVNIPSKVLFIDKYQLIYWKIVKFGNTEWGKTIRL